MEVELPSFSQRIMVLAYIPLPAPAISAIR
jgi:hypothetical protein